MRAIGKQDWHAGVRSAAAAALQEVVAKGQLEAAQALEAHARDKLN